MWVHRDGLVGKALVFKHEEQSWEFPETMKKLHWPDVLACL